MLLIGPMVLAVLIFFSALPAVLRMVVSGLITAVAFFVALVPVGGRPFDKWFAAFIKAVFSPTQRVWIKEKRMPEFLNVVVVPQTVDDEIPEEITEKGRERLIAYLKSLPKENESVLDVREAAAISRLGLSSENAGFGSVPPPIIWPTARKSGVPSAVEAGGAHAPGQVEVPKAYAVSGAPAQIKAFSEKVSEAERPIAVVPVKIAPKISSHAKPYAVKGLEDRIRKMEKQPETYPVAPLTHLASETNFSVDNIISLNEPNNKIRLVRGVGQVKVRKLHFAPPENFDLSKLPVRGERRFEISDELAKRFKFEDETPNVVLPNQANATVGSVAVPTANMGGDGLRVIPKQVKQEVVRANVQPQEVAAVQPKVQVEQKVEPKFSITDKKQVENTQANQGAQIIPLTSTPNVLSGLVMDSEGVPVVGAVLVVRDSGGIPVRALKTNKLGQFLSATPLSSGDYTIEVESEQAVFVPTAINLKGEVLQPLGIHSRGKK